MRMFVLQSALLVGFSLQVFAGEMDSTSTKQSTSVVAGVASSKSRVFNSEEINALAESLEKLVGPMEQKVDDCDGEVALATEELSRLESALEIDETLFRKTFAEIRVLKNALCKPGCKVLVGCRGFDRTTVAKLMETRIDSYHATASRISDLRNSVASQKIALEAAISKQAKWRAKERDLLEKVDLLEKAHEQLLSGKKPSITSSVVENISLFQLEVDKMLGMKRSQVSVESETLVQSNIDLEVDLEIDADAPPLSTAETLNEVEVILGDGK